MHFHHHGYVSGDPRVQPAAGVGIDRPTQLPDEVDVLIVGTGPAGMLAAAQLSQFPGVTTRIVERRAGRLAIGQADGIQARSVETFQAFGFAERIIAEAYRITEMAFWKPDPAEPLAIVRSAAHPRRPGRDQRVPAPHRQPGPRAGLLRRVHGRTRPPACRPTTATSSVGLEVGRGRVPRHRDPPPHRRPRRGPGAHCPGQVRRGCGRRAQQGAGVDRLHPRR